jgi:hypothetical protein
VVVGATSVDITGTFTTQFLLETSASPGGAGTISPTTGYIDQGTPITVTATAFPGATFTSWSGDCTGSDPCQLAMTKPMAVTANFTVTSLTVTIIVPAGVQFVFSGATYTGTQTLTVPPGAYGLSTASAQTLATGVRAVFVSWSDGGAQAHQIIAPATVGGSFKTQDLVTVTVAAAPENQGAASGGGWYDSGTTATIIATPNAGAELYYWNQGAFQPHPAEATFSFNVVAPVSFVAHFGTKQNWVQLFPSTSPDPRDEFAMAYCTTNNTTHAVLFGGLSKQGKTLSDTWVWDGVSTWMSIATPPGSTPSARSGAAMAEDSAAAVLMFGGTDAKGSVLSDTWVFDCTQNQWTLIQPTTVPPGRTGAAMASSFGPLMFGGRNGSTYLGDTWQWTGTDWLLLHPAQSPAPRANAAMALHVLTEPYIQHISIFTEMLFGGTGSNNGVDVNFSDTWAWDQSNVTWILQPPAATPPGTTGPMATNVLTGQLLLFDPNGGTWGNDGLSWAKKSPAVTPPARGGSEMQWNLSNGIGNTSEILLFGGHASASGAKLNDTWVWLTPSPSLTAQGATVTRTGGNYTVTMTLQNTGNVPDASIVITGADLGGAMSKGAGSIGRLNPGATGTISATFSVKSVSSLPGVPVTVVFVGTYSANGVSGIPWTGTLLVFLP